MLKAPKRSFVVVVVVVVVLVLGGVKCSKWNNECSIWNKKCAQIKNVPNRTKKNREQNICKKEQKMFVILQKKLLNESKTFMELYKFE